MERYYRVGTQEYRVRLYYDLGGVNYFSGKPIERGYHLSVSPVKREDRGNGVVCITMVPTEGVRKMILPVNRKSEKAYQKALLLAEEQEIRNLFDYILGQNYQLEEIS